MWCERIKPLAGAEDKVRELTESRLCKAKDFEQRRDALPLFQGVDLW
jgi:hypothetical protein